jgi:hypothetical protein
MPRAIGGTTEGNRQRPIREGRSTKRDLRGPSIRSAESINIPAFWPPGVPDWGLAVCIAHQRGALLSTQAHREATDEAYKAMVEQTPKTGKKVDPWEGVRAAPAK